MTPGLTVRLRLGALLYLDDCGGSSVERTANLHPLWQESEQQIDVRLRVRSRNDGCWPTKGACSCVLDRVTVSGPRLLVHQL